MEFFKSTGIVQYFSNPLKAWVLIDSEIARYYRALTPIKINKQKYDPHISIVRKEQPTNMEMWEKHKNRIIEFNYSYYVYNDERYYWLEVYSEELEEIRVELGLPKYSDITKSPSGKHKFHTTIGNLK